jgi:hypothetical protein
VHAGLPGARPEKADLVQGPPRANGFKGAARSIPRTFMRRHGVGATTGYGRRIDGSRSQAATYSRFRVRPRHGCYRHSGWPMTLRRRPWVNWASPESICAGQPVYETSANMGGRPRTGDNGGQHGGQGSARPPVRTPVARTGFARCWAWRCLGASGPVVVDATASVSSAPVQPNWERLAAWDVGDEGRARSFGIGRRTLGLPERPFDPEPRGVRASGGHGAVRAQPACVIGERRPPSATARRTSPSAMT